MKKKYEYLFEVIELKNSDVILTSGEDDEETTEIDE